MKGPYDNSYNRNRRRIDLRPQNDPATAAGMRNVHRGMRGEILGGVTGEGQAIGTKAGKPAWRGRMGSGGAGAALGAPNALGGGLGRWRALNPYAGKFGKPRETAGPGETIPAPLMVGAPLGPVMPDTVATKARAVGGRRRML